MPRYSQVERDPLLLRVDLDAEADRLAHRGLGVVGAEDPEFVALVVLAERRLVGQVEVLVRIHPHVPGGLVPQHREVVARSLRVAVPVDVEIETLEAEDPGRIGLGFVEDGDPEDPVARRRVGGVAVDEASPRHLYHVVHLQPAPIVLDLGVEDAAEDLDLGDRLPVEGVRGLQFRDQHVGEHVDLGDRHTPSVEGGILFEERGGAEIAERAVPHGDGTVAQDGRPHGVRGWSAGVGQRNPLRRLASREPE